VPDATPSRLGHIPGADFLDLQGEFSQANIELHFICRPPAQLEGRVRPSRHWRQQPGGAVLDRHGDVGDAVLVDAEIARL
jgi:hypothetical protein